MHENVKRSTIVWQFHFYFLYFRFIGNEGLMVGRDKWLLPFELQIFFFINVVQIAVCFDESIHHFLNDEGFVEDSFQNKKLKLEKESNN
jgi:hypothetical protein